MNAARVKQAITGEWSGPIASVLTGAVIFLANILASVFSATANDAKGDLKALQLRTEELRVEQAGFNAFRERYESDREDTIRWRSQVEQFMREQQQYSRAVLEGLRAKTDRR